MTATTSAPEPTARAAAQDQPIIEVSGLRVRFGSRTAEPVVDGVSFTVARGECLALVGESGSGKSVTARTLIGLTGPGAVVESDHLRFDGEDSTGFSEAAWRRVRGARIGFVMQDALSSLDPLRTVGAEIAEPLRLHAPLTREQREREVARLLTSVGVPEPAFRAAQHPYELSGGLRQRALIASAIACDPDLVIADEPTTALDATVAAQVVDLLRELRTSDRALLVISHDLAVVSRLADRVAVMRGGRIVETGPTEEVLRSPRHPYTRELLDAVPSAASRATRLSGAPPLDVTATRSTRSRRRPARGTVLIEADGLQKSFRARDGVARTAVDGVSFTVSAGETLGIVGESGSGKTTTARILLGLETADAGAVRLRGRDCSRLTRREQEAERRHLQAVHQDPLASFDPRYTVERTLNEALRVAGLRRGPRRAARLRELLALVRLDEAILPRRPIELSGGQRQRVAIARALAPEPEVVVCDEPVSALDVSVQARILDLLKDLQRELDLAYLFISHDLGVIHHLSDRVLVMKDGAVVESGDVEEVFARPAHPYTQALLDAVPRLAPEETDMPEPKKLHVNLFEMNCVGHISHGLWVHPDNNRHRFNDIEFWLDLARLLEHGTFDAVFLADVIGAYDGFRGGPETALSEAVQIPNNDPLLLIPAMAAVTSGLGFAATFSTTYEPPFAFARRMSTLDHLTKGRVAWNVVTSYLPNAARNFGLPDEVDHDQRYEIADEYLEVLYKLWEGSWDDDAVIQDAANRVYTDPAKVRYINHVGRHYTVAGPHLSQPSRQRTPVIYQAGSSEAGRAFGGRHAEAVFVGGGSLQDTRAYIEGYRAQAKEAGRDPRNIKFLAGAAVITGATDDDVARKVAEFTRLRSVDGHLAHSGAGLDWTRYSARTRVGDIIARKDPGYQRLIRQYKPELTVGDILDRVGRFDRGPFYVAGTPKVVADAIEDWLDEGGIDGINLRQFLTPGTAEDFIEFVVPELRRRGRFRESYEEGETLRERLFGAGNARLLDDHPGTRFRAGHRSHPAAESGS